MPIAVQLPSVDELAAEYSCCSLLAAVPSIAYFIVLTSIPESSSVKVNETVLASLPFHAPASGSLGVNVGGFLSSSIKTVDEVVLLPA